MPYIPHARDITITDTLSMHIKMQIILKWDEMHQINISNLSFNQCTLSSAQGI